MSQQSPTIKELLKRNAIKAQTHQPLHSLNELNEQKTPMPKIFIVSCCDNRLDPFEILGLEKWDAVSVRSCAGRMTPQMQNLLFLDHVLQFNDVMIIHHTDCSAELFSNSDVRDVLTSRAPEEEMGIERLGLPGFEDLEQSVRDDVKLVRESTLVRKELVERTYGFIYDIVTGNLRPVV